MHPVLPAPWRWVPTLALVTTCAASSIAGAAGTDAVPAAVTPPPKAATEKNKTTAAPARTNPTTATSRSVQYYDQSRFDEAIALLRDLVESEELEDKSRARALEILARCYVKKGYPVLAKDMFKELLAINPGYRPDPVQVPPDEIALFDRARKEFLAEPEGSRRTAARAAKESASPPPTVVEPNSGRLDMHVQPYASFYVDDTLRATNVARARVDLAPGQHLVRVVHPAFEPREWKVRLAVGQTTRLEHDFPATSAGVVRISTGAVWAEVFLDGRNTGRTTPCVLEGLSFGNHTVTVARAGFQVAGGPQVIPIKPGETATATFRLVPTP